MKPDWRFMVTQKAILKQIGLVVVPDTDLVVPPLYSRGPLTESFELLVEKLLNFISWTIA